MLVWKQQALACSQSTNCGGEAPLGEAAAHGNAQRGVSFVASVTEHWGLFGWRAEKVGRALTVPEMRPHLISFAPLTSTSR